MCLYIFVHIKLYLTIILIKVNQHTDMQIRQCLEYKWGMPVNANEEMLADYADPDSGYPDADPYAT